MPRFQRVRLPWVNYFTRARESGFGLDCWVILGLARAHYIFVRLPAWRYWVLPLAFLAFWSPIDAQLNPDFNPLLLLNSSFGVMFCPTTPVVIAILSLFYPRVGKHVLRITSFVGLIIGLFNALSYFIMPDYTLWNLFLHTPLILISLYGLLIPILVAYAETQGESAIRARSARDQLHRI